MSSNRLSYDDCDNVQRNLTSVSPLEYQLYSGKYLGCNWCGKKDGYNSELSHDDRVTIETDLFNLNRKTTKCSNLKFQPSCSDPASCELPNTTKFVPALACERDVVWTNLVKPTDAGLKPVEPGTC